MATREYKFWQGETIFHRHVPERLWQSGGISRAIPIGKLLRNPELQTSLRALSQSAVYCGSNLKGLPASELTLPAWAVLSSMHEIIHRGVLSPVSPTVDEHIVSKLKTSGWDFVEKRGSYEAVIPETVDIKSSLLNFLFSRKLGPYHPITSFEDEISGGKSAEQKCWDRIFSEWPELAPYAHPQVYFSNLFEKDDRRRADILLNIPLERNAKQWKGIVLEIHGRNKGVESNRTEQNAQQKKKADLNKAGWQVLDIPRDDVFKRYAPWTKTLSRLCDEARKYQSQDQDIHWLFNAPWLSSQLDLIILHCLAHGIGKKPGELLNIVVPSGYEELANLTFKSFTNLQRGIENIWQISPDTSPLSEVFLANIQITSEENKDAEYVIRIEPEKAGYLDSQEHLAVNHMIVRRICLPCDMTVNPLPVDALHSEPILSKLIGQRPELENRTPAELTPALLPMLRRVFGKKLFRERQVDGIFSAIGDDDRLILLPAGHGKSLIFQLSALLLPGLTIVVEPLRALLDDQILGLQDNGLSRCTKIHADYHRPGELDDANIVYIAPERLYVTAFKSKLDDIISERGIDLLVVDEAHSVSECGHSFRTAYLGFRSRIMDACKECKIPRPPPTTLCLTATAVHVVVRDVTAIMNLGIEPIALKDEFAKENIKTESILVPLNAGEQGMRQALYQALSKTEPNERTLIFCNSRGKWTAGSWNRAKWYGVNGTVAVVQNILDELGRHDAVTYYHGDLEAKKKTEHAAAFISGQYPIMVTTKAFGTGIDVANVRNVIHVGTPEGLEAWYQESARAGRDGKAAKAFILADIEGEELLKLMTHAQSRKNRDSLQILRKSLKNIRQRGSFARQMFLMIGNDREWPISAIKISSPLPKDFRMASFPGWRLEHQVHNWQVLNHLLSQSPNGGVEYELRFHSDHENQVWKTIHRLSILGIIRRNYQRTYHRNRPNTFTLTVLPNLERLAAPDNLVKHVSNYILRLLGGSARKAFVDECPKNQNRNKGLFHPDLKSRLYEALRILLYTGYEAIRIIRINSFVAMRDFIELKSDEEKLQYINGYISRDPGGIEFLEAVEEDEGDTQVWENWLHEFNDPQYWASKKGLLAQATSMNLSSCLPDFLSLAGDLRNLKYFVLQESALHTMRIINNEYLEAESVIWAFNRLAEINIKTWLDVTEQILQQTKDTPIDELPGLHLLHKWLIAQPNIIGDHPAIHLAVANYIKGALS